MRALALALLLAACAAPRDELPMPSLPQRAGVDPVVAARAEGVDFRAVGHAPDFVLQIYRDDRITLAWDAGAHEETFPKTEPVYPRWNGEIYHTHNGEHALMIEIRRSLPCVHEGERFESTVRIEIDRIERRGCGRSM